MRLQAWERLVAEEGAPLGEQHLRQRPRDPTVTRPGHLPPRPPLQGWRGRSEKAGVQVLLKGRSRTRLGGGGGGA